MAVCELERKGLSIWYFLYTSHVDREKYLVVHFYVLTMASSAAKILSLSSAELNTVSWEFVYELGEYISSVH